MICKFCEKEIAEGLVFCPECGKRLEPLPEPVRAAKNSTAGQKIAVIASGIALLLGLAAVLVIALMPKRQKSPDKLFKDFDAQFTAYATSCVEDHPWYNEPQNVVDVYLDLTNLGEKDLPVPTSEDAWEREDLPTFCLYASKGGEEYEPFYCSSYYYNKDGVYILNSKDWEKEDSYSILAGDVCGVDLKAYLADLELDDEALADSYVAMSYHDKTYYWDLENRLNEPKEIAFPWDISLDSIFVESGKQFCNRRGLDPEWYDTDCSFAYIDATVTNRGDRPLSLYPMQGNSDITPWLRIVFPEADWLGKEDRIKAVSGMFYDENGVYYCENQSYEKYTDSREYSIQPGESCRMSVEVYFDAEVKDPAALKTGYLEAVLDERTVRLDLKDIADGTYHEIRYPWDAFSAKQDTAAEE